MGHELKDEEIYRLKQWMESIEVHQKMGVGVLGATYAITHPQYGKCVLKWLGGKGTQNKKFLKRFLDPMGVAKSILHPNFAQIYEVEADECRYVLREWVEGFTLKQKLDEVQQLSLVEANHFLKQMASGLDAAYSSGLVNKNIKSTNILIGSGNVVKIVDFSMPPTAPYYLSPEQCEGKKSDVRSDIYALGAIYYYCLCGCEPYSEGTPKDVMEAHIKSPFPKIEEIRNDLPPLTVAFLKKMLAKSPEERPQSYAHILNFLNEIDAESLSKPATSRQRDKTIAFVRMEGPHKLDSSRLAKFKQVASDMVTKLRTINQTLSLLDNVRESQEEATLFLDEMLHFITSKTGEFLCADRTLVFLLDQERGELWSMDRDREGMPIEIRIALDQGITGEVAQSKKNLLIPFDFYQDPRSASRKEVDVKTGYRTYTMLLLPLLDKQGNLIAVIQLLNKLKKNTPDDALLAERIDSQGFDADDEVLFEEFAPSMRLILESSQAFYKAIQRQRAAAALMAATQSLSQCTLDLSQTLNKVMNEAQRLMNADRSTLWLLDEGKGELWTNIQMSDGVFREVRIPKMSGFVGQVASSGEPLLIPFDLYDHPDSSKAKEMDQITGYRTCSMLCMPVFNNNNELIAVTQLINKKKQGENSVYDPKEWPAAPECWKSSFNRSDMEFMKAFNMQAGIAIQNAKLFATVKQQEQMQRDILRSLTNGVFSTDKFGRIMIANESARRLLGDQTGVEGQSIQEIIRLQEGDFGYWVDQVLQAKEGKYSRLYYPEQTLLSKDESHHSINLSINSIADVTDGKISGALVVMDDISHEKRIKTMMYRYMTQEVAEQLLSTGEISLGGQLKEVTVLFSDIRSYTTLTEGMRADEVVALLNEYFEEMVDVIFKYKGTLDKYIGDAIMAVFGAPLPLKEHAWCAVQTALEMSQRLKEFNRRKKAEGKRTIKIGIGINSGEVISGNIGSSKRMELTAIGDGVNLSSRLEGTTKQYGCQIIVSEKTYRPNADRVYAREIDFITVKGKTEPVMIYEIIGLRSDPIEATVLETVEKYETGRELYRRRQFKEALEKFQSVLEIVPDNLAAQIHVERCELFLKEPPEENWDGVWKLTEK